MSRSRAGAAPCPRGGRAGRPPTRLPAGRGRRLARPGERLQASPDPRSRTVGEDLRAIGRDDRFRMPGEGQARWRSDHLGAFEEKADEDRQSCRLEDLEASSRTPSQDYLQCRGTRVRRSKSISCGFLPEAAPGLWTAEWRQAFPRGLRARDRCGKGESRSWMSSLPACVTKPDDPGSGLTSRASSGSHQEDPGDVSLIWRLHREEMAQAAVHPVATNNSRRGSRPRRRSSRLSAWAERTASDGRTSRWWSIGPLLDLPPVGTCGRTRSMGVDRSPSQPVARGGWPWRRRPGRAR